jgi:hypothetical protein
MSLDPIRPRKSQTAIRTRFESFPSYEILRQRVEKEPPFNPIEHKDKTRSRIASIFTWGFFILVSITLIGIPILTTFTGCNQPDFTIKDTMLVISGVVGGPFGFVLGHYFKSDSK